MRHWMRMAAWFLAAIHTRQPALRPSMLIQTAPGYSLGGHPIFFMLAA